MSSDTTMVDNEFVNALNEFGSKVAMIDCTPASTKSKSKSRSKSNTPSKFVVRFSSSHEDDEAALCIDALNLSCMYQLVLDKQALVEHVSAIGFQNCPWNRYFEALCNCVDGKSGLALQRGKGGGYVELSVTYPISDDIQLTGTLHLCAVEEYCQRDGDPELPSTFKRHVFESVLECAVQLAQNGKNDASSQQQQQQKVSTSSNHADAKSTEWMQHRIATLEQENMRLKASNNRSQNTVQLTQSFAISSMDPEGQTRKRKQRDPSKALINPRRPNKRRKVDFSSGNVKAEK